MPESTPIYGFTYPCPGETVAPADFTTLADQIDTVMGQLGVLEFEALNRRNVSLTMPAQSGIAAGVATVLTNPNSSYVTPEAGLYLVSAVVQAASTLTMTSSRLRIRQNTVQIPGETDFVQSPVAGAALADFCISGVPVVAAAGDTIDTIFQFFGTGTASVILFLNVRLVAKMA